MKKNGLENLSNLTEKQLCWSHLIIKLQTKRPATLLKRDSTNLLKKDLNTGVFL